MPTNAIVFISRSILTTEGFLFRIPTFSPGTWELIRPEHQFPVPSISTRPLPLPRQSESIKEIKLPLETNDSILPAKHEESSRLTRGHSRDNKNDPAHDGNDGHSGRRSSDSLEEVIW